jgi:type I restriction enzyme, S subunit
VKHPNDSRLGYKKTKVGWIPEEWEESTVGKCCRIRNELRRPISSAERGTMSGPYRYYGPTGVLDHINEYRIEGEFALIGEDGDHFLKSAERSMTLLVSGQYNVNNHAHVVEGGEGCTTEWFHAYFQHRDIRSSLTRQGIGRYKLNKDALACLPTALPPLPQQEKITEILFTCDEATSRTVELIEAKQRQKKALVQQLLTCKRRLPGFTKKWLPRKLSELFERVTRRNVDGCQDHLTISGAQGLVNQEGYFSKQIASRDASNYFLLRRGEFAYNKSSSRGYPLGAIKMLVGSDEGVVSTLYICFRLKRGAAFPDFARIYFEGGKLDHELYKIAQEGARHHGLLNVTPSDFFNTEVLFPDEREQVVIAAVVAAAEQELAVLSTKLVTLKQQKKSLMQKLLTGQIRVKV